MSGHTHDANTTDHDFAEVSGGFVHEIKNHLNTLSMNLQLLAEDFADAATPRERKAHARVERLSGECRRLVELANDFLRFARGATLNLVPTDLSDVVSRLVDFLTPTASAKNIDLAWHPAADLPRVPLDPDLFETVLFNLLLNAEEAMPDGGLLTVQAQPEGNWLRIDIIDTGHGMPADVLAKAFRPFVTTKPGGTGLGLATAKRVVTAHGGRIIAESEPGRGTRITLLLPVS